MDRPESRVFEDSSRSSETEVSRAAGADCATGVFLPEKNKFAAARRQDGGPIFCPIRAQARGGGRRGARGRGVSAGNRAEEGRGRQPSGRPAASLAWISRARPGGLIEQEGLAQTSVQRRPVH